MISRNSRIKHLCKNKARVCSKNQRPHPCHGVVFGRRQAAQSHTTRSDTDQQRVSEALLGVRDARLQQEAGQLSRQRVAQLQQLVSCLERPLQLPAPAVSCGEAGRGGSDWSERGGRHQTGERGKEKLEGETEGRESDGTGEGRTRWEYGGVETSTRECKGLELDRWKRGAEHGQWKGT